MKRFEHLSCLIECSSGVTPTVGTVKEYIKLLSKMGYDRLYLGMADAYKIKEEPFFNYKRGGYSTSDLNEIDKCGKENGVEVIAQIHTLSHLHFLRKYPDYFDIFDTDNILMVGEERIYVLIEHMIKAISEGLSTRRIHLGLDEAFGIGTGDYLKKYGPADKKELILRHLKRVFTILEKYGYTCEMWGDMLTDMDNTIVSSNEVKNSLPENSVVFAWNYDLDDENEIGKIIEDTKKVAHNIGYAGAAWKYLAYGPCNRYSISRIIPQMRACVKNNVSHYMLTLWSDNVAPCSFYAALPSIYCVSEFANGNYDGLGEMDKEKFYNITGIEYDVISSLEFLDNPFKSASANRSSSSFWIMYTDLLLGNFDTLIPTGTKEAYAKLSKEYNLYTKGKYGHVFKMSTAVAKCLSVKATLPKRIREAYLSKDKEEAENIIIGIKKLKKQLSNFINEFTDYFTHDNMPFGVEVHHLYLGGQIARCDYAIRKLRAFIDNDEPISELEGGILNLNYNPMPTIDCSCMVDYRMLISYCIK